MEKGAFTEAINCTSRGTLVVFLLVSLSVLLLTAIGNHRNSFSSLFSAWTLSTEKSLNHTSVETAMAALHNQSALLVPTDTSTGNHTAGNSTERLNDTVPAPNRTATHVPPPFVVKTNSSAETLNDTVPTPNGTATHKLPPIIVESNSSAESLNDTVPAPNRTATRIPSPIVVKTNSSAESLNDTVSTLNRTATHRRPPIIVETNSSAESLNDTVSNENRAVTYRPPPIVVKTNTSESKLLGGLLPSTFDEKTCISRYQAHLYHKPSPHQPSPALISRLRNYELLHERCGPNSSGFKKRIRHLTKTHKLSKSSDCNYIVWMPGYGLGNRVLSIASTFLYAMLTDRVLLVTIDSDMADIFCDPFPNSTWILPNDFPHRRDGDRVPTFERVLKDKTAREVSPFVFVNLAHGDGEEDRVFHCDEAQAAITRVPVLFLRSDQFYAPSLFMIDSFHEELTAMFPEKNAVFHHLGRYLYNPSDRVWKLITQFYNDNLKKADHKVGIQVRVFAPKLTPPRTVMEQILACTMGNNILPKINENVTSTAVLVTSLFKDYSENLTAMYSRSGGRVRVFQPSHEGIEKFDDNMHKVKALAEIHLLSMCDVLVTSGMSTFGYVAHSLGAMKPWIMDKTVGNEFRNPPCVRAFSMDPCFHVPPVYDCKRRVKVKHISSVFPYMKQCEDYIGGLKMIG